MCIRDRLGGDPVAIVLVRHGAPSYPVFEPVLDAGSELVSGCLLYTSDAADERSSVDLGGRRIIKKKKQQKHKDDAG